MPSSLVCCSRLVGVALLLAALPAARAQAPALALPPASRLAFTGRPFTLAVSATGAAPLSYQWKRLGQMLPGATTAQYTVAQAGQSDRGWYEIVVSNVAGTTRAVTHVEVVEEKGAILAWGDSYLNQSNVPPGLGNVVAIAAGRHTYALRADGSVVDFDPYTRTPLFAGGVVAVSAGPHLLALQADGTVGASGDNFYGQANVPSGLDRVVRVAAGGSFSLALRSDGAVVAWGGAPGVEIAPPANAGPWVDVAAGASHALGLRADGTVAAWGGNAAGQATVPAGLSDVVAVSAGGQHSLALRRDGSVVAWGGNADGQSTIPAGLSGVVQISAGGAHSLARKADGSVVAWGGQLRGYGLEAVPPPLGVREARSVAAGGTHNVVLVPAEAPAILIAPASRPVAPGTPASLAVAVSGTRPLTYVWRKDGVVLASATGPRLTLPAVSAADAGAYTVDVANAGGTATTAPAVLTLAAAPVFSTRPLSRRVALGAPATFSANAIGTGAVSYQWRRRGQPITGATSASLVLPAVTAGDRGHYEVIATDAGGGLARSVFYVFPVPHDFARAAVAWWGGVVAGSYPADEMARDPIQLSAGSLFTLALESDGQVSQWGGNGFYSYTLPPGLNQMVAVTAAPRVAWAVKADARAWEWSGQAATVWHDATDVVAVAAGEHFTTALLADGTLVEKGGWYDVTLSDVSRVGPVAAIAAGRGGLLALRSDGTVAALRNAAWSPPPAGLAGVRDIAVGDTHYLALKSDGTVVGWGAGAASSVPPGLTGVLAIASGDTHALALRSDGSVVAWGANPDGRATVPADAAPAVAVAAGWDHSVTAVRALAPTPVGRANDRSVLAGGTTSFQVGVFGVPPYSYRWYRNDVALSDGPGVAGSATAALTLTGVSPAASGTYRVVVTDATGSVTWTAGRLTVVEAGGGGPPANDAFAAAQVLNGASGSVAGHNFAATGEAGEPLHGYGYPDSATSSVWYAWTAPAGGQVDFGLSGSDFPSTLAIYAGDSLAGLVLRERGSSDSAGWAPNRAISVRPGDTVRVAVASTLAQRGSLKLNWIFSPAPGHDDFAGAAILNGAAGSYAGTNRHATREPGEAPLEGSDSSVWHRWTAPVPGWATLRVTSAMYMHVLRVLRGADLAALTAVATLTASGAGSQTLRFEVAAGTTYHLSLGAMFSAGAAYTLSWEMETMPVITVPPASRAAHPGDTVSFAVTAAGGGLVYQWYHDGATLPGATGATLTLPAVGRAQAGDYQVRVRNLAGSVLSVAARLGGPAAAPTIVTPPAASLATAGQAVTLAVTATGTGPLAYQWRRRGVPLAAATGAALAFPAVSRGESDDYDVAVYNGLSRTVSPSVRLAVAPVSYPGFQFFAPAARVPERDVAGPVWAVAPLADGRFYVAGDFESVGGRPAPKVARYLASGVPDPGFVAPVCDGTVWRLLPEPGGGVMVAGTFTVVDGEARPLLVRLAPDGSLDRTFAVCPLRGTVQGLTRDAAGRTIVFGSLTHDLSRNIFRLLADGRVDPSFTGSGGYSVSAVLVQSDGRILMGSDGEGLVRLLADGAPDPTFSTAAWRVSGTPGALLALGDGRILAGGSFALAGGGGMKFLVRLSADGQLDPTFAAAAEVTAHVGGLAGQSGGRILVTEAYNGAVRRLLPDGALDLTFHPRPSISGVSYRVAVEGDGRVLLGLSRSSLDAAPSLLRLTVDGVPDTPAPAVPRKAGVVTALANLSGGATLAAGNFAAFGGMPAPGLVRLHADGSPDSTFVAPPGLGSGPLLVPQADGGCYVLSHPETIRRLLPDGRNDPSFALPAPLYLGESPQAAGYPGGRLLVTGGIGLDWAGGVVSGLVLLAPDGARETMFNPPGGPGGGVVKALAVLPDGRVVVGGSFTSFNGAPAGRVVRLLPDGRTDPTFAPGGGFNGEVRAVHLQGDGRVVVAGTFTTWNGAACLHVARLLPDGSRDATFASAAPAPVKSLLVQEDGKVIAAALVKYVQPPPGAADWLVRLNADGSRDATWRVLGQPSEVGPLLLTDAGSLRAGVVPASGSDYNPTVVAGLAEYAPATAPMITVPPATVAALSGETVEFSVAVSATGSKRYQWGFNGRAIPGATAATLRLTGVALAQSGAYTVTIANDYGSVTSAPALLKGPNPLPAIQTQPAAASVRVGEPLRFSVAATAIGAIQYQWRANGSALPGGTAATLDLGAASLVHHEVEYDVVVSDGLSVTVSAPAVARVVPASYPEVLQEDPGYRPAFEVAGGSFGRFLRTADGHLYLPGLFSRIGGVPAWNVARLKPDGTVDPAFRAVPSDGPVDRVAVQADGGVVIAGRFTTVGGQSRRGVARLRSDGSLDPGFAPVDNLTPAHALAVQPDGKVLVGGGFTVGNGIVRLLAEGTRDPGFVNAGPAGFTYDLALQADGRIVAGGSFIRVGGSGSSRLLRLLASGALDPSFNVAGVAPNSTVQVVHVLPDGRILLGGSFYSFGGNTAGRILRLTSEGAIDPTWSGGSGFASFEPTSGVNVIEVQPDGRLLVQGGFNQYQGTTVRRLVRLQADGALDSSFQLPTAYSALTAVGLLADGRVVIGGNFTARLTVLSASGPVVANPLANAVFSAAPPQQLVALPGGEVIAVGYFTRVNGVPQSNLARLRADGSLDPTLQPPGSAQGFSGGISGLLRQGDGRLVLSGVTHNSRPDGPALVRLNPDGSNDATFRPGYGFTGESVGSQALRLPGDRLLVEGRLNWQDKVLLRLAPDGSLESQHIAPSTGFGTSGVNDVVELPDRSLVVAGSFTQLGAATVGRIVRFLPGGARDGAFGPSVDGTIHTLALQPDGKVVLGGEFLTIDGVPAPRLARLHADGSLDSTFRPGFGPDRRVLRIRRQADGALVILGEFTAIDGVPLTAFMARVGADGRVDPQFAALPVNGAPQASAWLDDGSVLLAGPAAGYYQYPQFDLRRFVSSPGPVIAQAPQGSSARAGQTVRLAAAVAGAAGATLQWWKSGQPVPGATAAVLTLSPAQAADSGNYLLRATAGPRLVDSPAATVTVADSAPVAREAGAPIRGFGGAIALGSRWPLTAPPLAAGSPPLAYQWTKDGTPLTGATGARLDVPWTLPDGGVYRVTISNPHGTLASAPFPQLVTGAADWTWAHPAPQGNPLADVTWLNGRFLAGGARGTILTSADGLAWNGRRLGVSEGLLGFAYQSGDYVALAEFGGLWHSYDTVTWTRRESGVGADGRTLQALAAGGGRFVAVGSRGLVVTSGDGLTWTTAGASTTDDLGAVAFGGGRFHALGEEGRSVVSPDGMSWSAGPRFPRPAMTIAFGDGRWVVGAEGLAYVSADGGSWFERTIVTSGSLRRLQHQNGRFLGVVEGEGSQLVRSTDGMSWQATSLPYAQDGSSTPPGGVAYGADRYVVVSAAPDHLLTSGDGYLWSRGGLPGVLDFSLTSLAADAGQLHAGGVSLRSYTGAVWSSTDGTNWSAAATELPGGVFGLACGRGAVVAVGAGGHIRYRMDGGAWAAASSGTTQLLHGVDFVNGHFLAVGGGGTLLVSPNGRDWSARPSGVVRSLYQSAYGGGRYVVVGDGGTVVTSGDGLTWTVVAIPGVTAPLAGVAHGTGGFAVASEAGHLLTSPDGLTWTVRTNPLGVGLNRLIFAGGRYHAFTLGNTNYLVSTDGATWVPAQHGSANVNVTVAEFGGRLFLGGSNAAIVSRPLAAVEPVLTAPPVAQTAAAGGRAVLTAAAAGTGPLAYQWFKDGVALPGATGAELVLPAVTRADAAWYAVRVANEAAAVLSAPVRLSVSERGLAGGIAAAPAGLVVQGAFTVEGNAPKRLLVRGLGPALAAVGRTGVAADPRLRILPAGTGVEVAANDDWGGSAEAAQLSAVAAQVGALPLPAGSRDAAVLVTLAPGAYRVVVEAAPPGGAMQVEVHEADDTPRLVYLGVLGPVGETGLVQGIAILAPPPGRRYLVRALGPSLGVAGALADPQVAVFAGATPVASNDNWGGGAGLAALAEAVGAMPLAPDSRDAALEFAPAAAGSFTVQATGTGGTQGLVWLEIFEADAQRAAVIPPAVVVPPESVTVAAGQPARLGVVATGRPLLAYQWRKDGNLLPALGPVLNLPAAQLADAGAYTVRVTAGAGGAEAVATVTVTPADNATQAVAGRGYVPGGTVTIANALHYTGSPANLAWALTLPAGWSLAGDAGALGGGRPAVGATGTLTWAWSGPPPSPVIFTCTLAVPAGESATRSLAATFTVGGGAPVPVAPAPLIVAPAPYHSADTDGNQRLSLFELTRVIELFNTRYGSSRTGCYRIQPATEDGYAPEPARAAAVPAGLAHHHSADSNRDGKISLFELTRVIELFNFRAGAQRTGQYRVQAGTEDGFAPGP